MRAAHEGQLLKFIQTLDRPQEGHLFSEDVAITHPHILASYSAICPDRMDLRTMREKAQKGGYYRLDDNYAGLRQDISLMVNNCLLFNHDDPVLCEKAKTFHAFATEAVDRFCDAQKKQQQQQATTRLSSRRGPLAAKQRAAQEAAEAQGVKERTKLVERFVQSINRIEDERIFSLDVAITHPHILEAYTAVCPHRMDLSTMAKYAKQGRYSATNGLESLEADVRLIADNCIKFNGIESYFGTIACKFRDFALDELAKLRVAIAAQQQQQEAAKVAIADRDGDDEEDRERPRQQIKLEVDDQQGSRSAAAAAPPPRIPLVRLPHQVPLDIPPRIRMYVAASHVRRANQRCQLPAPIPASRILAAFVEQVNSSPPNTTLTSAARQSQVPATVRDSYNLFVSEMKEVITRNFNNMFPRVLLYDAEKIDLMSFLDGIKSSSASSEGEASAQIDAVPWIELAGCQYLIRFLIHLPQLSCKVGFAEAKAHGAAAEPVLKEVARRQVEVVTIVVEDLLNFIEASFDTLLLQEEIGK